MAIGTISDGEAGVSVRTKLNLVINSVNTLLVPYTGATTDVNLGTKNLSGAILTSNGQDALNTSYNLRALSDLGSQLFAVYNDGHIAIGSANPIAATVRISADHTGGATGTGIFLQGTVKSDQISAFRGINVNPTWENIAFNTTTYSGLVLQNPALNAGLNNITTVIHADIGDIAGNNNSSQVTNGYGIFSRVAAGVANKRWNLFANGTAPNYMNGSLGIGLPSSPTTSDPDAKLEVRGIGTTVANYAVKIKDSTATSLFEIRNDGFVGIKTSSWINPFNLGNFALKSAYLWVDLFDSTDVNTGIAIRKDGDDSTAVVIGTKNSTHGLDNSKNASIKLNNSNGFMSFGGYQYTQQKFDFQLNYQNTNVGSQQRFAVSSGLHTIGTGGNICFYGASNSVSNTAYSYASIYGVKENNTDVLFNGKLSLRVNDGVTNHVEIERMAIGSNGQVNINYIQNGSAGLSSGDIYYDAGAGNVIKYVP